nr:hypothetical protein [Candidatus Freyarchaeota archaeon]
MKYQSESKKLSPSEVEELKRKIEPKVLVLREDVLTPLDAKLFARRTADGGIEVFELVE